jgi:hypothetical protein
MRAEERPTYVRKRVLVAIAGAVAGLLIGSVATWATGWRWWVRICVALAPALALLVAERRRFVRTAEEINRPISLLHPDERERRDPPA